MDGGIGSFTWIDVGSIADVPRQGARKVSTSTGNIAVFRTVDDDIFALVDRCPHKAGPLSEGIVHGRSIACPLHNWTISLETGEAAAPDEGCTRTIPVRLVDGRIEIRLTTR